MEKLTTLCKCFLHESYVNLKTFKSDFSCFKKKKKKSCLWSKLITLRALTFYVRSIKISHWETAAVLKYRQKNARTQDSSESPLPYYTGLIWKHSFICMASVPFTLIRHKNGSFLKRTLQNGAIWKCSFIPSVRPTVYTNLSRHENGSFLKRALQNGEIWKRSSISSVRLTV